VFQLESSASSDRRHGCQPNTIVAKVLNLPNYYAQSPCRRWIRNDRCREALVEISVFVKLLCRNMCEIEIALIDLVVSILACYKECIVAYSCRRSEIEDKDNELRRLHTFMKSCMLLVFGVTRLSGSQMLFRFL
jgi:hypothetical protein